jgi:hypothetical protein
MTSLDDLLVDLLGSLTTGAGGADGGAIEVTHADLDLPVESRLAPDGRCWQPPARPDENRFDLRTVSSSCVQSIGAAP